LSKLTSILSAKQTPSSRIILLFIIQRTKVS